VISARPQSGRITRPKYLEGTRLCSPPPAALPVGTAPALSAVSSSPPRTRLGESTQVSFLQSPTTTTERTMTWTKPEAEVVAVTMEVTAYVATL
jgi:hypothetical protein